MNNKLNTFMQSMLEAQGNMMEAAAQHRDQLSQAMSSIVHNHLDASIERLQRFHDLVSHDTSGMKSDVLAATLKSAIDHHHHIKDRFATHTHHANTHKRTLRRLAMGAMAAFGVMSGVKAADAFESGSGSANTSSGASSSEASNYQTKDVRFDTTNAGARATTASGAQSLAALYQARPAAHYRDPAAAAGQSQSTLPAASNASSSQSLEAQYNALSRALYSAGPTIRSGQDSPSTNPVTSAASSASGPESSAAPYQARPASYYRDVMAGQSQNPEPVRSAAPQAFNQEQIARAITSDPEGSYEHTKMFQKLAEKHIERAYAPNATVKEIFNAANSIANMAEPLLNEDLKTKSFAVVLEISKKILNHSDASNLELLTSANLVQSMVDFIPNAEIRSGAIQLASDLLGKLESKLYTAKDQFVFGSMLIASGAVNHAKGVALLERSASPEKDLPYALIKQAADQISSLDAKFHDTAAKMYLNAANHRDASADVISRIISKIEQIRATYPADSAEYKKYDALISEIRRIKESRSK